MRPHWPADAEPRLDGHASVYARDCPSRVLLEHVTGKWAVLILSALSGGTHRFSELRRRLDGVSEKMLAQTLRTLENDGLVTRTSHPQVPPRVEYSLTQSGHEVAVHLERLVGWIEWHTDQPATGGQPDDSEGFAGRGVTPHGRDSRAGA